MPKLWEESIAAHRHQVSDAILDTAAGLAFENGLRSVTMAQIAEETGIGRATLYKYFPDVDTILRTWHHRQVEMHLAQLIDARDGAEDPSRRLAAVLRTYARIAYRGAERHDTEIGRFLHRDEHLAGAERQLHLLITGLIEELAAAGGVTRDSPPDELAAYCLHALNAAAALPSEAAVDRLVTVTLAGLGAAPPREGVSDV